MLAYKELQDILASTLQWEQAMLELYQVAELGVKNEDAAKTITYLMENHTAQMEVLKNIKIENYGPTEWVKFSADLHEDDIIPKKTIKRDSTSQEICSAILDYEKNLKLIQEAEIEMFGRESEGYTDIVNDHAKNIADQKLAEIQGSKAEKGKGGFQLRSGYTKEARAAYTGGSPLDRGDK